MPIFRIVTGSLTGLLVYSNEIKLAAYSFTVFALTCLIAFVLEWDKDR